ncbi:penicillin-binding protein activator LpoB [Helicobacter sp. 23-1044]
MIFAFIFCACSSNQPQYVDSRDYVSFELDNHDIGDMTEKLIKSLLNSPTIKKQKTKKVLAIGSIENNTKQNIDIEMIANEIINLLNESGKFEVVNAGQNAKIEQLIRDSRKMREDKEYNPYETIEEGELIPPHYGLTGKISQKNKKSGDDEIVEYVFSLTLTSLKSGKILWARKTKPISKKLPKEEVVEYDNLSNDFYGYDFNKKQDEGPSVWEKIKEFFSADGMNYFVLDLGVGSGIGFSDVNISFADGYNIEFLVPININAGYLRTINDDWAFSINMAYNKMGFTIPVHRLGGEIVGYYGDGFGVYFGGGFLRDISSQYNKKYGIDSWYLTTKLGINMNIFSKNISMNMLEVNCVWDTKNENYLNVCGMGASVRFKF